MDDFKNKPKMPKTISDRPVAQGAEELPSAKTPVTGEDVDRLIEAIDQLAAATLAAAVLKPGADAQAMADAMDEAEKMLGSK